MKFATALLGVLCFSALQGHNEASTTIAENTLPSNYTEAAATISALGISYWMVKYCKDFFKKGILPDQISSWKGNEFSKTLAREAVTAVLFATTTVCLKTLFANQFGGKVLGDGKIVAASTGSNPQWVEKAWSLGTALAFAHLAYEIGKGSIAADAFRSLKSHFSKSE